MKKLFTYLTMVVLFQNVLFGQNYLAFSNKFCTNKVYVCSGTTFSDTVYLEWYIQDPMLQLGDQYVYFDSLSGVPLGVNVEIPDSVISFNSPTTPLTSCSSDPTILRQMPIIFSGSISQPGTYQIYASVRDSCYGYYTNFMSGPYLTGYWNYPYYRLLCTIIVDGSKPAFTFTQTPSTCGLSNGSIQAIPPSQHLTVSPPPYQYNWLSNGDTTPNTSNLASGFHTLNLIDEIGCLQSYNIPLGTTGGPSVTVDTTFSACSNTGLMTLQVTGNAPFTYSWQNGNTTSSQSVNRNTYYSGLVNDANNCPTFFEMDIPNRTPLQVNDVISRIKCHGDSNGKITLTPLYGTPPYTYSWSNGVTSTTNFIDNLSSGVYYWSVTDANGCTFMDSTIMINPPPFHIDPQTRNASCEGNCDGKLFIGYTGGWGYAFIKRDNQSFSNLPYPHASCAGSWLFKITDQGGCSDSAMVAVGEDVPIITSMIPECIGMHNGAFCADEVNPVYSIYEVSLINTLTWDFTPIPIPSVPGNPLCVDSLEAGYYQIDFLLASTFNACANFYSLNFTITEAASATSVYYTYTQNGNNLNLTAQGGTASNYSWSAYELNGGASPIFNNDTIANPICTVPSTGSYIITLTINAGGACQGVYTDTIACNVTCDIGGVVSIGGTPADDYKVYLINYDANTQLLTAIDSLTGTAANAGAYVFSNLPIGDYRVKASLLPTSAHFVDYLPTYYQNALLWNQADVITLSNPCLGSAITYDIALTSGVNTSGVGFIGGYVFNGANRLLQDTVTKAAIEVILFDNAMQPIAYDYSDANGYVSFGGLPMGTYHLMADALNQPSDTLPITLTTASPTGDFLFFMLGDGVSGSNVTSIDAESIVQNIQVLPNPHSQSFTIQSHLTQSADAQYQLYNTLGQKVWEANQKVMEGYNEFQVISADLPSGVYFLHLTFNAQSHVVRKVIKE